LPLNIPRSCTRTFFFQIWSALSYIYLYDGLLEVPASATSSLTTAIVVCACVPSRRSDDPNLLVQTWNNAAMDPMIAQVPPGLAEPP
jgi:hypothetical protein